MMKMISVTVKVGGSVGGFITLHLLMKTMRRSRKLSGDYQISQVGVHLL